MGMRNFGKILYKKRYVTLVAADPLALVGQHADDCMCAAAIQMFDALPREIQWRTKRDLQHESDVHRLYMLTRFREEGCQGVLRGVGDADPTEHIIDEEAIAADIAARAEGLSFLEQKNSVQAALRQQVEEACQAMHTSLLEARDPIRLDTTTDRDKEPVAAATPEQETWSSLGFAVSAPPDGQRRSGLPLHIKGHNSCRQAAALPDVPKPGDNIARMSMRELSAALQRCMGYTLRVASSGVDHPDAGQGLWLDGHAPPGSLVAFYPGVVYDTEQYRHIPGYPHIDRNNSYLISRYDGVVLDAKPWAAGDLWGGTPWPPVGLRDGPHSLDVDGRNPLALAHFANHPAAGISPNVMVASVELPCTLSDSGESIRRYLPNITLTELQQDTDSNAEAAGSTETSQSHSAITGLCLVATAHLEDEEVFLNYRYSPHVPRPSWYVPVDAEEDRRRWAT